jgi:CRP-like cAMP-binding protein
MMELNLVEKVIALEGVDLLSALAPEQAASIAMIAREVDVPPGSLILDASKPVDALYVVLDGSVELLEDGNVVDTAEQNAVLGAWALFDESDPIPLTARAVQDTRLLRIGRDDFYDLLADNSDITSAIFSTLVKRFRKLVEA